MSPGANWEEVSKDPSPIDLGHMNAQEAESLFGSMDSNQIDAAVDAIKKATAVAKNNNELVGKIIAGLSMITDLVITVVKK